MILWVTEGGVSDRVPGTGRVTSFTSDSSHLTHMFCGYLSSSSGHSLLQTLVE